MHVSPQLSRAATRRPVLLVGLPLLLLGAIAILIWPRPTDLSNSQSGTTPAESVRAASSPPPAVSPPPSQPTEASRHEMTRFRGWVENYVSDIPSQRSRDLDAAMAMARASRAALKQLIPANPADAFAQAVPVGYRSGLPPEIVAEIESRVEGVAKVSRSADGTWQAEIHGKTYRAFFANPPAVPGELPILGVAVDDLLAVGPQPWRLVEPGEAAHDDAKIQIVYAGEVRAFPDRTALDSFLSSLDE